MEGTNEVQGERKRARPPRGAARRSIRPHPHSHPFEVRRKAVQLCLEEGFPVERVAREMGVGLSTLSKWVRVYREQGEGGLQAQPRRASSHRPKVAAASIITKPAPPTARLPRWTRCQSLANPSAQEY